MLTKVCESAIQLYNYA